MIKHAPSLGNAIVAKLCRIDPAGRPWIDMPGRNRRVRARLLDSLTRPALDRSMADGTPVLVVDGADGGAPTIIGLVVDSLSTTTPAVEDEVQLTAGKRLTLRCGKATITLTEAGKVIVRGAYVSQRSTGVMIIDGASVRIA